MKLIMLVYISKRFIKHRHHGELSYLVSVSKQLCDFSLVAQCLAISLQTYKLNLFDHHDKKCIQLCVKTFPAIHKVYVCLQLHNAPLI